VTISQIIPVPCSSAPELANAFGSVVFEPQWWPDDSHDILYELYELQSGLMYQIGSARTDGRPIRLVGQTEAPERRLPKVNWYAPPDLKPIGGMVAETHSGYQAVIHQRHQTVQLIGYLTEADVVCAALSLSPVSP
jgi:hypothetical protein